MRLTPPEKDALSKLLNRKSLTAGFKKEPGTDVTYNTAKKLIDNGFARWVRPIGNSWTDQAWRELIPTENPPLVDNKGNFWPSATDD